MNKGDKVYFARIIPNVGLYEVLDLKIRMVESDWFSATEKRTNKAYIFSNKNINNKVFMKREDALKIVKEAEKHKKIISDERYYEEY